ncbi:MAG TPA: pitrilysin family protein [Rhizomicrobium sp.]|nr:pitrilysin family protein [Rhizomicrobium sp.]
MTRIRSDRLARIFAAAPLVATALFLAAASAHAADPVVAQFALPNGMQVVVIEDHRAPVVTEMIWYKVGAMDDPPGHSGLAHFFEHMMFRGTKAAPGGAFSQTLARNGGDDNAFTTEDYTAFYEQLARDRLKLAMTLEADRMAHLDLSDPAVRTERDVVLEERRMRIENSAQALAAEQVAAALYLSHPYGRPVIGWPQEVHRLGRAEAQSFYDRHYAPNNAIAVIAGDVTPDEVRADAATTLALVPPRTLEPRALYAEPERLGETRLAIARPDATVANFSRAYRVPSYAQHKAGAAEALEVLAALLGTDANGALYRKLVVEQKLATDAGASYDGDARDSGEFGVYATPRPGVTLAAVEEAVDAVIAGFVRQPPAAADLARARTQLVASEVFRRDSQLSMATAYGQALAVGLSVAEVQSWPRRIAAVTPQAVQAAAATALVRRQSVTLYLTPGPA